MHDYVCMYTCRLGIGLGPLYVLGVYIWVKMKVCRVSILRAHNKAKNFGTVYGFLQEFQVWSPQTPPKNIYKRQENVI